MHTAAGCAYNQNSKGQEIFGGQKVNMRGGRPPTHQCLALATGKRTITNAQSTLDFVTVKNACAYYCCWGGGGAQTLSGAHCHVII